MTPSFVGFPIGVKAGSYDNTFDMSLASSYNGTFITAKGGTVGSAFMGGEVRALLSPVPEPTTALLALGGLGLVSVARRRQRG
jgi:hypothetical protein